MIQNKKSDYKVGDIIATKFVSKGTTKRHVFLKDKDGYLNLSTSTMYRRKELPKGFCARIATLRNSGGLWLGIAEGTIKEFKKEGKKIS